MRSTRRTSATVAFIEPLEARALLAADVSVLTASTTNLAANGNKSGKITIKNTGTVPISGPVTVTFVASAAGQSTQTLGTTTITLNNLKPKATKPVTGVTLTAPTNSGSSNVKFNIVAKITPDTTPADASAGNNSKAAGSVTIKPTGGNNTGGGTSGDGATVFGATGYGTKLKFKKSKSLPGNGIHGFINESGTFTDENGNSGTYQLALPPVLSSIQPPQILNLDFKKGGFERSYTLTFTPIAKRFKSGLNGKTITFSTSSAGSAAKGIILSTFLPTIYLKY